MGANEIRYTGRDKRREGDYYSFRCKRSRQGKPGAAKPPSQRDEETDFSEADSSEGEYLLQMKDHSVSVIIF